MTGDDITRQGLPYPFGSTQTGPHEDVNKQTMMLIITTCRMVMTMMDTVVVLQGLLHSHPHHQDFRRP